MKGMTQFDYRAAYEIILRQAYPGAAHDGRSFQFGWEVTTATQVLSNLGGNLTRQLRDRIFTTGYNRALESLLAIHTAEVLLERDRGRTGPGQSAGRSVRKQYIDELLRFVVWKFVYGHPRSRLGMISDTDI